MERERRPPRGQNKKFTLVISGFKSILPTPVVVEADLDQTWRDLLTRVMKLKIHQYKGVYLRTLSYVRWSGTGFSSELDDTVASYVNKFRRRPNPTCVRICRGTSSDKKVKRPYNKKAKITAPSGFVLQKNVSNVYPAPSGNALHKATIMLPSQGTELFRPMSTPWRGLSQQLNNDARGSKTSRPSINNGNRNLNPVFKMPGIPSRAFKRKIVSSVPAVGTMKEDDPSWARDWDATSVDNDSEVNATTARRMQTSSEVTDDASVVTTVSQEVAELRMQGISFKDVKLDLVNRFSRLPNTFFLRMEKEYKTLNENNLWVRIVERAPVSSFLIHELFR